MPPKNPLLLLPIACILLSLLSSCSDELSGPSASIQDPSPSSQPLPLDPGVVCRDQRLTPVLIHGQNLSPVPIDVPNNPRTALPTISLALASSLDGTPSDGSFSFTYNGDPDKPENGSLLSWQSQDQMTLTIAPPCPSSGCPDGSTCHPTAQVCVPSSSSDAPVSGPLQEGIYNATISNPNTSSASSLGSLAVVQQPTVASISPGVTCLAQGPRDISLSGTRFLNIQDAQPQIEIESADSQFTLNTLSDCTPIPHKGYSKLDLCSSASATLAQDSVDVGYQHVSIHNPETAPCFSEDDIRLRVVPPPQITAIREESEAPTVADSPRGAIICLAEGDRNIIIHGQDLLAITPSGGAEVLPSVMINGTPATVTALGGECEDLPTQGATVRKCTQLSVTVPESLAATTDPTATTVSVTNPDPAGCADTTETRQNLLVISPPPDLLSVIPSLVCLDDGARQVRITGTNFLDITSTLPSIDIGGQAIDPTAVTAESCQAVDVAGQTVQRCTDLLVTLAQGSIPPGQPTITVTNPDTAGCSDAADGLLTIPPSLTIAAIDPANICVNDAGVTPLTISGSGFLTVDGTPFTLSINGQTVTPDGTSGCTDLNVQGLSVQACDTVTATFDATGLPVGDIPVSIQNPSPSECAVQADASFRITAPPTITSIAPPEICSDVPETFTMRGTNLTSTTNISITSPSGTFAADAVTFVSDTELTVTFSTGVPADTYDVTASNGSTCTSTLPAGLTVNPTPLVFFVDPPVVFNGIATEVTVFTSGLTEDAQSVQLIAPDDSVIDLPGFTSPVRSNRILATIPANLAAGDYRVSVTSADDCTSVITAPLTITDTLTLALDAVDPPFASPTTATAVTVTATDPAPNGQVQFTSTPRVYLNPDAGGGNAARALRAVVFQDATSLSAVVPPGMTPGLYDLIVVNPGGEVGVLDGAVTVTAAEPPLVTTFVPGSLVSSASSNVTILGDNFDAAGVEVSLTCRLPGGATTTVDATAEAVLDSQTVTATIPPIGTAGAVCIVRLTNTDGAYFDYSAVSTTNSSRNLNPWAATQSMTEPRRALSLEAGRPTATSRFLYAIGGDAGAAASAKDSVEGTNVSVFGDLSPWTTQRYALPSPRTLASSAIIGRYIYLIGGHDGANPTDEVLRAEILNPLAAPEVTDLDAQLGTPDAPGILTGLWHYRVAAVFPDTDPSNPDGESLPGEVQSVELPDLADGVILSLTWEQVPGASGYRLYRTPSADAPVTDLQLLIELSGETNTSFIDDGQAPTDPAIIPLPQGSLGQWHAVEALSTARQSAAAVAARNPNDPDQWFLYAFNGVDGSSVALNTYEHATVTVDPTTGAQTMSPWTVGSKTVGLTGRSLGAAWVVDNADTSLVPQSETYVFVGLGANQTGNSIDTIFSGRLDATSTDGELISATPALLDAENGGGTVRACGYGDASGFLYYFGGYGSSPNPLTTDSSSELTAGPNLNNPNSLAGGSLTVERAYPSTAQESAFFFTAGGETSSGTPTASVEKAVQ